MKSPIISAIRNKAKNSRGFLVFEAMIAFLIGSLLLVSILALSATMQGLHDQSVRHLQKLETAVPAMDSAMSDASFATSTLARTLYGDDTQQIQSDPLTVFMSDYQTAWGRDSCDPRINFDANNIKTYLQGINIGAGNPSTDIEVRDGIIYLTADSSTNSAPDFYIINAQNPAAPFSMSSLNTGPGVSAVEIAGHYAYLANTGTTNQLQVVDISNRNAPVIISKFKLPLPMASSTAPAASAIFYSNGFIYLGTQKWDGNEFSMIDVSNPASPQYVGGFKTNTLINDMYVRSGFAYLAASDAGQMRILDVHNPQNIFQIASFSPTGWETQEGRALSYFEGNLFLGRTTGGFNVLTNYEIFNFSTTTPAISISAQHDIPGGVYGIIYRPQFVVLATHATGHEFQVWNPAFTTKIFDAPLSSSPQRIVCDGSSFYFATGDQKGFGIITAQ